MSPNFLKRNVRVKKRVLVLKLGDLGCETYSFQSYEKFLHVRTSIIFCCEVHLLVYIYQILQANYL